MPLVVSPYQMVELFNMVGLSALFSRGYAIARHNIANHDNNQAYESNKMNFKSVRTLITILVGSCILLVIAALVTVITGREPAPLRRW